MEVQGGGQQRWGCRVTGESAHKTHTLGAMRLTLGVAWGHNPSDAE